MKRIILPVVLGTTLLACASGATPAVPGAPTTPLPPPGGPNPADGKPHTFTLGDKDFLLDGKPFALRCGEMHYARIPRAYWRHRIQMAKAMGLNAIGTYVFWNRHETEEGKFDFKTDDLDLAEFLRIAQEEGMWVLLRPGPYVCSEYDFGGIPPYLLRHDDIKIRCMDPRYMTATERYMRALAPVVRPLQVSSGGPILMVQIENEYGSYPPGRDRKYLETLCQIWRSEKIDVPFYTADGPYDPHMTAGHIPGCAIGMDPAENEEHFEFTRKVGGYKVPVFNSELYPGWLTHWGEGWFSIKGTTPGVVDFCLKNKYSFNLFMTHGGTNWDFMAGANSAHGYGAESGTGSNYQPHVTSYEYGSPIDEQGCATPAYMTYRDLIARYLPSGEKLPEIPTPVPAMRIPEIKLEKWASLWDRLPEPILTERPKTFESIGQNQGCVLYRHTGATPAGKLSLRQLHDFAVVVADGKTVGAIDRRKGESSIDVPAAKTLDILVEGMGHINFFIYMTDDRKGITKDVFIGKDEVTGWVMHPLPLRGDSVTGLPKTSGANEGMPGGVFRGSFHLDSAADTFLDLRGYTKGFVWVNGHNLGRYWNIGPQHRLYCPAPWLKKGANEIVVLDLVGTVAKPVCGMKSHADKMPSAWEGKK